MSKSPYNLELEKLRALESALRAIVDDDSYGAGGLGHHDDCNIYHAWGPGEVPCDCYVKEVISALKALKEKKQPKQMGPLLPLCMSYCRFEARHEGKCEPMEGR